MCLNCPGHYFLRFAEPPLSEGFGELPSLEDLNMEFCCHALAKNEETYAILSRISTLTKLSLAHCDMESLTEGSP